MRLRSPQNTRGAVLLLAVYFTSLMLLTLSGIALQRTETELRAAERSVDVSRAFWTAEGGLDTALSQIRQGSISLGRQTTWSCGSLGDSTATCRAEPLSNSTLRGNILETTWRITVTGQTTRNKTTSTVTGTLRTQRQLKGIMVNGWVNASSRGFEGETATIQGDIRSAAGGRMTVALNANMVVRGNVTIGPPAPGTSYWPVPAYTKLWGYHTGDASSNPFGVSLTRAWRTDFQDAVVTGAIYAEPMPLLPPISPPAFCLSRPWIIEKGNHRIQDGDPLDLSGRGDGQVEICVPYVFVGEDATVTFQAPTTLYVTSTGSTYYQDKSFYGGGGYADGAFHNNGIVQSTNQALTVVTTAPKRTRVTLGRFSGSVYAPNSTVTLYTSGAEENAWLDYGADLREWEEQVEKIEQEAAKKAAKKKNSKKPAPTPKLPPPPTKPDSTQTRQLGFVVGSGVATQVPITLQSAPSNRRSNAGTNLLSWTTN